MSSHWGGLIARTCIIKATLLAALWLPNIGSFPLITSRGLASASGSSTSPLSGTPATCCSSLRAKGPWPPATANVWLHLILRHTCNLRVSLRSDLLYDIFALVAHLVYFLLEGPYDVFLISYRFCLLTGIFNFLVTICSHQVIMGQVLFDVHVEGLSFTLPLDDLEIFVVHLFLHFLHLCFQLSYLFV